MKYTLRKADKYFLSFIYAPIIPIILFLSGWWVSLPFYRDNRITIFALTGLAAGILIDILFRRKLINEGYRRSVLLNSVIFLFYSVMGFGFFMGVPVFHPALGIIAGLYIARKSFINGASAVEFCQSIRVCAFFLYYRAVFCLRLLRSDRFVGSLHRRQPERNVQAGF